MKSENPRATVDLRRRRVIQQSLVAAGVAWTVPVVSTIFEPVAAAAGSTCPYTFCFDSGTTEGWTIDNTAGNGNGLWQVNNGRSVSSAFSLHYGNGVGGNYNTGGTNAGTVTSAAIGVPTGGGNLTFDVWRQVETYGSGTWDEFAVTAVPTTGAPAVLYAVSRDGGTGGVWVPISLSLNAYGGQNIQIVFSFDTKDAINNNFEGIWVDNVTVPCNSPPAGSLGLLSARSLQRGAEPTGFFPETEEPSARDLRRRRRDARSTYTGTVSE